LRHSLAGCLLLVSALAWPGLGHAGNAEMAWDRCAGLVGSTTSRTFACADDTTRHRLVVSASTPFGLPDFVAAVVTIDVALAGAGIPDWWRFADGGCRAGAATADIGVSTDGDPASCHDPWGTGLLSGTVGVAEGYLTPNRIRIQFTLAQSSTSVFPIGQTCRVGVLTLPSLGTVTGGGGSGCAGCATAACLSLTQVELFGIFGDQQIIPPGASHVAGFQQPTPALCATPARQSSWGAIKALYR